MFQSFASYQPFQGGNNPNKATASNSAPMSSSLATPSAQPQNTGGPLTSSLLNTVNNAAEKGASNLMGGSSADAKNQLMATLAKGGNPIAQSAITPISCGGTLSAATPTDATGAQGMFDGIIQNIFGSGIPATSVGASSIAPAASAATDSAAASGAGDAAASSAADGAAASTDAASAAGGLDAIASLLAWL